MTTNTNNGGPTPTTSSKDIKTPVPAMPKPLQPRLCLQRDDNTVVPLVAMDELPDSVILKGVPVKLTVLDALKARMELITGDYPAHGVRYELDRPIKPHSVANGQSDDSGSDVSPTSEGSESSPQKAFTASDKKGNKNAKDKALVRTQPPFSHLTFSFTSRFFSLHACLFVRLLTLLNLLETANSHHQRQEYH